MMSVASALLVFLLTAVLVNGGPVPVYVLNDPAAAIPLTSEVPANSPDSCKDYLSIEASLLSRSGNLENLSQAFFPINHQASIAVNVTYVIGDLNETYRYIWFDSAINLFISGELLEYLSIFMYNVKQRSVTLTLDTICNEQMPIMYEDVTADELGSCQFPINDGDESSSIKKFHLLGNLTSKLLSYAIHRNSVISNGIDSSEGGCSVFVTNQTNYCVFEEDSTYWLLHILLCSAFGLLELALMFAVPLILFSIREEFKKKMSKERSPLLYFVWAATIAIAVLVIVMCGFNVGALFYAWEDQASNHVIRWFLSFSMILPFGDILFVMLSVICWKYVTYKSYIDQQTDPTDYYRPLTAESDPQPQHDDDSDVPHDCFKNCFNLPVICDNECCIRKPGSGTICNCVDVIHCTIIVIITWFVQLLLFNSVFIFFGGISAPVETGSIFLLVCTSLFALISFLAMILKVFAYYHEALLSHEESTKHKHYNCHFTPSWSCCSLFVLHVILAIVCVAGIAVFFSFIYTYTILSQEYRNNRGILAFLAALLPALLTSSLGFFWMKVIPCIGKNNTDDDYEIKFSTIDVGSTDSPLFQELIRLGTFMATIRKRTNAQTNTGSRQANSGGETASTNIVPQATQANSGGQTASTNIVPQATQANSGGHTASTTSTESTTSAVTTIVRVDIHDSNQ